MLHSDETRERARVMHEEGLSVKQTSERLGVPASTVHSWFKRLEVAAPEPAAGGDDERVLSSSAVPPAPAPPTREKEHAPRRPPGGKVQQVDLDYAQVQEMIEGAYLLAGQTVSANDPALAMAINEHAAKAGLAWSHWIRSEPKVAALLQRLMIGTPLGEVIGVHVSIVFAYVLARGAQAELARERAAAAAAADNGPVVEPAARPLV